MNVLLKRRSNVIPVLNAGLPITTSCSSAASLGEASTGTSAVDTARLTALSNNYMWHGLTRMRSSMPATIWYRVLLDTARKPPHARLFWSTGARSFSACSPVRSSCLSTCGHIYATIMAALDRAKACYLALALLQQQPPLDLWRLLRMHM